MLNPIPQAALAAALLTPTAFAQIHVDASAAPNGDGTSWASPFSSLDDALAVATPGTRVWVAEGVYRPTVRLDPADPRTATFAPPPGVRLFGGFRGDETSLASRAGSAALTILDGDIGVPGARFDNARNVVRLEGNGAIHVVDGFTITGGYADGTGLARGGGGIAMQLGTKTIRGCIFRDNYGSVGGALLSQISIVEVDGCTFERNGASRLGGAVYATSTFSVTNSLFSKNIARQRGGAVYANQGGLDGEDVPVTRFQNCVFTDNVAANGGAAFVGDPSGPVAAGKAVWSGCTFYGNAALMDGASIATPTLLSSAIVVDVQNSILWANRAVGDLTFAGHPDHFRDVAACIVEGGWTGTDVLDVEPRFTDGPARILSLAPGSPAIDAGWNDLVLRDTNDLDGDQDELERAPIDAAGAPRRADDPLTPDTGVGAAPLTDMGAYEFVPAPPR